MLSKSPRCSVLMESSSLLGLSQLQNAPSMKRFTTIFDHSNITELQSVDVENTMFSLEPFPLHTTHNKLQTPTVSNVNSDCLYSELLRFPSIIGPWEDRILPQPAGETHTEEKKRAKNEKGKRDSRVESAQRNRNPFPLGSDSLVPLPASYLMSLRRIRVRLSLCDAWQRERSSQLCGQTRPSMTGRRVDTGAERHYCQNEARTRWDGSLQ